MEKRNTLKSYTLQATDKGMSDRIVKALHPTNSEGARR